LEETSSLPWLTGVGLAALYWYTQRMNRWVRGFTLLSRSEERMQALSSEATTIQYYLILRQFQSC
jgi:hypothetical protein